MIIILSSCKDEQSTTSDKHMPFIESISLMDSQGYTQQITLSKEKFTLHNSYQPIIIINVFNTLSIEAQYQLKMFSTLQVEFQEEIFILSLFTGDDLTKKSIHTFLSKHNIKHFVVLEPKKQHFKPILYESLDLNLALALPINILYTDSHYIEKYTGTIPIEMMRYVIREEIKKLKAK